MSIDVDSNCSLSWNAITLNSRHFKVSHHTIVFSENEKKGYLFGGCLNNTVARLNDSVYEINMDNKKISLIEATGDLPQGTISHTAILVDDLMYIFGGKHNSNNNFLNTRTDDFYSFNIHTHIWEKLDFFDCPPPVSSHQMAYIYPYIYIIGGNYEDGSYDMYNPMHVYRYHTVERYWKKLNTSIDITNQKRDPSSISKQTVTEGYPLYEEEMLYCYNDSHGNDTTSNSQNHIVLCNRKNHGLFTYRNEIYIYGGVKDDFSSFSFNSIYKLNVNTLLWTRVNTLFPSIPPPFSLVPTISILNNYAIITTPSSYYKQTLPSDSIYTSIYNLQQNIWIPMNTHSSPMPLYNYASFLYNDALYIYGGRDINNNIIYDTLFELDLSLLNRVIPTKETQDTQETTEIITGRRSLSGPSLHNMESSNCKEKSRSVSKSATLSRPRVSIQNSTVSRRQSLTTVHPSTKQVIDEEDQLNAEYHDYLEYISLSTILPVLRNKIEILDKKINELKSSNQNAQEVFDTNKKALEYLGIQPTF
ncbi:hypothetical protein WA158_000767 [Blastocystis sp. Blastoise]